MTASDTDSICKEIETAFPFVEMPVGAELPFNTPFTPEDRYLIEELEQFRDREISGKAIRFVHQEMSLLSAKAWQWLMPHYLRFCLTSEAAYNRMETEFLIYNLGPELKFQSGTLKRLSLFTARQAGCLIHFLQWCRNQEYWRDYCPENIDSAIAFLRTNLAAGKFT
jgi:hypothetical protein